MDGGAWWAAVHGVTKSRTWLNNFTFTFHFHALEEEMATHSSILAWRIPRDKGTWWAAVYGVTQSRTRLKWLSSSSNAQTHIYCKYHAPDNPMWIFRFSNIIHNIFSGWHYLGISNIYFVVVQSLSHVWHHGQVYAKLLCPPLASGVTQIHVQWEAKSHCMLNCSALSILSNSIFITIIKDTYYHFEETEAWKVNLTMANYKLQSQDSNLGSVTPKLQPICDIYIFYSIPDLKIHHHIFFWFNLPDKNKMKPFWKVWTQEETNTNWIMTPPPWTPEGSSTIMKITHFIN